MEFLHQTYRQFNNSLHQAIVPIATNREEDVEYAM